MGLATISPDYWCKIAVDSTARLQIKGEWLTDERLKCSLHLRPFFKIAPLLRNLSGLLVNFRTKRLSWFRNGDRGWSIRLGSGSGSWSASWCGNDDIGWLWCGNDDIGWLSRRSYLGFLARATDLSRGSVNVRPRD